MTEGMLFFEKLKEAALKKSKQFPLYTKTCDENNIENNINYNITSGK